MYEATVYTVMLGAPSDVNEEREIFYRVLSELNAIHSLERRVVLMPLHWSTHARPGMGDRAQALINRQVTDQSDLLIAVFHGRLGSPTGNYQSGTLEEIQEHVSAEKPVMVYFSDVPVPPSELVDDEYRKVKEFRKSVEQGTGLYDTYRSLDEFEQKLRRHVSRQLQEFLGTRAAVVGSTESHSGLSADARRVLAELAEDEQGALLVTQTYGGWQLGTNGREFVEPGSRRSEAAWLAAVDQLYERGLIEGDPRGISQITLAGFGVADSQQPPSFHGPTPDVRIESWAISAGPHGAGLVVHNIGDDVALNLEGQRLIPDGRFETSRSLKSLNPMERASFSSGWNSAHAPQDVPGREVPPGKYITRVIWEDRHGKRYVGDWTDTEKVS